jgi:hypothetical protein
MDYDTESFGMNLVSFQLSNSSANESSQESTGQSKSLKPGLLENLVRDRFGDTGHGTIVEVHPTGQQGCHNGSFWMKITVWTSARIRIYPADAVKIHPRGRFPAPARTWDVRANAPQRPCGHGRPRGCTHSLPPLPSPSLPSPADAVCNPRGRWAASARTQEK